ncbi:FAD-dependent oxidoreductase [Halobacterium salinarum]|nr:FAD-dependent oxidoreductase [Halobacterium salinarum]MDL0128794.1 FAD-dependent oxidoreductase [Halobacterium salinarum]MDL0136558.1 FAD-dependent oxidoreductase [Halobacterium salinarum]MDL0139672.1 FAD-dependent oxidoreductase [Halobacterium salinarum]
MGDALFVATSVQPNSENIGLETVGVETNPDGTIYVDEHFETTNPDVYAVGDVLVERNDRLVREAALVVGAVPGIQCVAIEVPALRNGRSADEFRWANQLSDESLCRSRALQTTHSTGRSASSRGGPHKRRSAPFRTIYTPNRLRGRCSATGPSRPKLLVMGGSRIEQSRTHQQSGHSLPKGPKQRIRRPVNPRNDGRHRDVSSSGRRFATKSVCSTGHSRTTAGNISGWIETVCPRAPWANS